MKNECDICEGKSQRWFSFNRCVVHNICDTCSIPRAELKEAPWGTKNGWRCKPCEAIRREKEKSEALARMPKEYDEWDYSRLDKPTCPHCKYELDDYSEYYSSDDEEVECPRCDNVFLLTAVHDVVFTSTRKKD